MKGLNLLFVDRPVQDAAGTEHPSAEEERTRELVVMDVLQEDQNHRVSAGLNDLVKCLMGCKPARKGEKEKEIMRLQSKENI